MPKFGVVPREVPVVSTMDGLAPEFRKAVERVVAGMKADGFAPRVFETLRTPERQAFLYGFGRTYDDGRGTVTKVSDVWSGWHGYGLAVDIVEADATPWTAPQAFWQSLGKHAEANGLTWGGRWKFTDLPHIQWGKCRVSPSAEAKALIAKGEVLAVWQAVGAV